MDRQTTFLLALGLFAVAALVVSVSGLVLFLRDRALHKLTSHAPSPQQHPEVAEGS